MNEIIETGIEELHARLNKESEESGYHLNPDANHAKNLVRGLLVNEERYGYRACPCRLATGTKVEDLDIVCPCDYRDQDIEEYGACYCGLYVSESVVKGEKSDCPYPKGGNNLKKGRGESRCQPQYRPSRYRCGDAASADTYVHGTPLPESVRYARRRRRGLKGSYNIKKAFA